MGSLEKKAQARHRELRKFKQKVKDLTTSRDRWRESYKRLKTESQQKDLVEQNPLSPQEIPSEPLYFILVSLCVNLNLHCGVSFRAVPKILSVLETTLTHLGLCLPWKIPHFTSVIHWSLRLGKFLLDRGLQPIQGHWICLIDHTIQVGTKKALVILKVALDTLGSQGAPTLAEAEVLYLKVQDHWNGAAVETCLRQVFAITGLPVQVVMDGGSDLNKGLRLFSQQDAAPVKVTYDLTHLIAKLLKKKYQAHPTFKEIMTRLAQTKNKLKQTAYAYLMPLKERAKSRFLNLPALSQWTTQVMDYLNALFRHAEISPEQQAELSDHLGWLFPYQSSAFRKIVF